MLMECWNDGLRPLNKQVGPRTLHQFDNIPTLFHHSIIPSELKPAF
jgi:hypothetical protein